MALGGRVLDSVATPKGILAGPTGRGCLVVAEDRGVSTSGGVPFHGSVDADPPEIPIGAIAVGRWSHPAVTAP
ncbi:hypothetical protein ACI8AA_21020 [Geodermatophilus sp. SYSU D01180]